MEIDWTYVKKKTLWQYEDLIGKLLDVLGYPFVQAFYNHGMPEAAAYARRMQQSYLQDGKEMAFLSDVSEQFTTLDGLGVRDIHDLVQRVDSEAKCERFLVETGFSFENLIQLLSYLMRYALPFSARSENCWMKWIKAISLFWFVCASRVFAPTWTHLRAAVHGYAGKSWLRRAGWVKRFS